MGNINDDYFNGYYKDIWRAIIPEELTIKETAFIIDHFGLKPGDHVLDLMCGYGRHAVALARKGIHVTAVDNLSQYVDEIAQIAYDENLPLEAINTKVLDFQPSRTYKLAICMGNSFNFFPADEAADLLTKVHDAIESKGQLLVNTWSLAETVIKNFVQKTWQEINGIKILNSCEYLFHPTRIEFVSTIIERSGQIEERRGVDHIFSVGEMSIIFKSAGFEIEKIYSIPGKKLFSVGDPRAYIVGRKML